MKYLILGGTGSLGKTLVKRLLGQYNEVHVLARGEEKHHKLKLQFPQVNCIIGDVRDYDAIEKAIFCIEPDIIINCAAMKQVPLAEDWPTEAVQTNINGAINLVKAVNKFTKKSIRVLSISTDKVVKPVNSYGMTKALQERIHIRGQDSTKKHTFNCVRYGNVLESTGSVIPIFKDRLMDGLDLQVTHPEMTRFLLSLEEAVDLIEDALEDFDGRKIFVPKVRSAKIDDLAKVFIKYFNPTLKGCPVGKGYKENPQIQYTTIRPGEKIHEILISEEELIRTYTNVHDKFAPYVIYDIKSTMKANLLKKEYSSGDSNCLMTPEELNQFLKEKGVYV